MITRMSRINWNKGVMDNGKEYDYTRCEIEVPIYENSENEFGVSTIVCEFGSSELHEKFLGLRGKLPAVVEIEIQQVKKGNNTLNQVVSFEFIESCQIDYSKYKDWRNQSKKPVQSN